ncbi:ribosomal protein S4 (apicoplast) [Toxoplasma gondii RH]|uniref:Small ribosomal subunit protein uS4c n=2 Tax=Toxoplasma gondii TaxID=5811 RepID=RR4_TOXGO|nr:ribosomal protein S4 [Toxoplasma gondii RH]Q9XQQ7.1 RecName: Full=Small ribosomal subunit protein uS4c; AltName: Full=Apicoplast 30S ribosomal protein S4 [Toxoplasma gondii]AAD41132.1 ribosomal protein S4 [Toxoplasma gondii]|eukprot:NP_044545.1 ribosomal protein S4 (apicoplast) [Toxoplasma gondii RH]
MKKKFRTKLKKLQYFKLTFLPGFCTKLLKKELVPIKKGKTSSFRIQLLEKQKLKYNYRLKENQIKKYFKYIKLLKIFNLIQIIELRLDATIFRLGFAKSINQARQLITHGFIFINSILVKKPSFILTEKDLIYINPKKFTIILICRINLFFRYYNKYNLYIYTLCVEYLKFKLQKEFYFKLYLFIPFDENLIKYYYKF